MEILPRELTQFQSNLNGEGRKPFFFELYASEFNGVVICDMKVLKILSSIAQGIS